MEETGFKMDKFLNSYVCGDCLDVLREVPEGSVDMIMTSPPYADQIKDYGDVVKKIKPDEYIDWFLPRAKEFFRVLKPTGSFVLNINDKLDGRFQNIFVFKLVVALCEEIGFHLVRDYIWYNITADDTVISKTLDVHVEGVASRNTKPILVKIKNAVPSDMNRSAVVLYHTENGEKVKMTSKASLAEVVAHNDYHFDPDGNLTMALAHFSEILLKVDASNPWRGEVATDWYNDTGTTFAISTAEQLAGLAVLVNGGKDFSGKTVVLDKSIVSFIKSNAKRKPYLNASTSALECISLLMSSYFWSHAIH